MFKDFATALRPALVMTILFAIMLGIVYPFAMTGLSQLIFPHQANGSLLEQDGRVIGSTVIGQAFTSDRYFQTRPSAAGKGYDGRASAGSNLGPAARPLVDRVQADVAKRRAQGVSGVMPADLVTASGSGLDPDLSPAAAEAQVARIARVRGIAPERLGSLIAQRTETSLFGDRHVNVLALNRALDAAAR